MNLLIHDMFKSSNIEMEHLQSVQISRGGVVLLMQSETVGVVAIIEGGVPLIDNQCPDQTSNCFFSTPNTFQLDISCLLLLFSF